MVDRKLEGSPEGRIVSDTKGTRSSDTKFGLRIGVLSGRPTYKMLFSFKARSPCAICMFRREGSCSFCLESSPYRIFPEFTAVAVNHCLLEKVVSSLTNHHTIFPCCNTLRRTPFLRAASLPNPNHQFCPNFSHLTSPYDLSRPLFLASFNLA